MQIRSECPLRVGSVPWQAGDGSWVLTLVCKGSFDLEPGEAPLSAIQEEVDEVDDHWDDDPTKSLRRANDLVPFKRHADVLVVGQAYAQKPVRSLLARLNVGSVDKSIEVWCDREFSADGDLVELRRFTSMSLRWERAAGGPGTMNPVGVPRGARESRAATPLPNLFAPGFRLNGPEDAIAPVGFGPVSVPPSLRRWMDHPLPAGFDGAYFNAAPVDQQLDVLRASDSIRLENLHPDVPVLVTALRPIKLRVAVRQGGTSDAYGLRCDTLVIDTDLGRISLVWRGQIPMRSRDDDAEVIVSSTEPIPAAPFRVGKSALAAASLARAEPAVAPSTAPWTPTAVLDEPTNEAPPARIVAEPDHDIAEESTRVVETRKDPGS